MNASQSVFVFPGQGAQAVGMAAEFYAQAPLREVFEEADDTLGLRLSRLMLEGPTEKLAQTENTQPALLTAAWAAWAYLARQSGGNIADFCTSVAGHSLGEYAALCVAGALDFPAALKLVRFRGLAMARAVPSGGAMAAVISTLPATDIQPHLVGNCWLANDNAEGQVVISGTSDDVAAARERLGGVAGVKKVVPLAVSGPFHSPLMAPAAEELTEELAKTSFQESRVPVVQNITAQPESGAEALRDGLAKQVVAPVRWRESMKNLAERGVENVCELGCGKVLTGLARRCDSRLKGVSLTSPREIDAWLERLEQQRSVA